MFASALETPNMISAKTGPNRAFMSKLNIELSVRFLYYIFYRSGCVMLSAIAGGACVAADFMRISMKFQIVVLRHVTSAMGILRHFLPWWRKNTNFPSARLPARAQMQFFCCKPEVTCPKDSYVTAGCKKSLLNTRESGIHYFLLVSIRFLLSQKYFDLQI